MRKTLGRFVVLTAAVATIGVLAPSASAADDWVLVGTSTAAASGVSVPIPTISLIGSKNSGPCVPKHTGREAHALTAETWWSASAGKIAFNWHNGGSSWVSDDCATAARTTVTITDYAPNGEPPVVRGNPVTVTQTVPSGGLFTAVVDDAPLWVVYYDLPLYMRGDSLVETKVHGEYRTKNGIWTENGCVVVYNTIHPTPNGPVYGATTSPEKCPA